MSEIDWGSVADWISGFGSAMAAVIALYLARKARRDQLADESERRRARAQISAICLLPRLTSYRCVVAVQMQDWERYDAILRDVAVAERFKSIHDAIQLPDDLAKRLEGVEDFGRDAAAIAAVLSQALRVIRTVAANRDYAATPGSSTPHVLEQAAQLRGMMKHLLDQSLAAEAILSQYESGLRL